MTFAGPYDAFREAFSERARRIRQDFRTVAFDDSLGWNTVMTRTSTANRRNNASGCLPIACQCHETDQKIWIRISINVALSPAEVCVVLGESRNRRRAWMFPKETVEEMQELRSGPFRSSVIYYKDNRWLPLLSLRGSAVEDFSLTEYGDFAMVHFFFPDEVHDHSLSSSSSRVRVFENGERAFFIPSAKDRGGGSIITRLAYIDKGLFSGAIIPTACKTVAVEAHCSEALRLMTRMDFCMNTYTVVELLQLAHGSLVGPVSPDRDLEDMSTTLEMFTVEQVSIKTTELFNASFHENTTNDNDAEDQQQAAAGAVLQVDEQDEFPSSSISSSAAVVSILHPSTPPPLRSSLSPPKRTTGARKTVRYELSEDEQEKEEARTSPEAVQQQPLVLKIDQSKPSVAGGGIRLFPSSLMKITTSTSSSSSSSSSSSPLSSSSSELHDDHHHHDMNHTPHDSSTSKERDGVEGRGLIRGQTAKGNSGSSDHTGLLEGSAGGAAAMKKKRDMAGIVVAEQPHMMFASEVEVDPLSSSSSSDSSSSNSSVSEADPLHHHNNQPSPLGLCPPVKKAPLLLKAHLILRGDTPPHPPSSLKASTASSKVEARSSELDGPISLVTIPKPQSALQRPVSPPPKCPQLPYFNPNNSNSRSMHRGTPSFVLKSPPYLCLGPRFPLPSQLPLP